MAIVKETTGGDFKRVNYLDASIGEHLVRFIDADEDSVLCVYSHWFKGSVACLGDECPQCATNTKIRLEHPDDYRSVPGYRARQPRYLANILVRSEVKVCPNCEAENNKVFGGFPSACRKCKTLLTAIEPIKLNEVRVLTKGSETFGQVDKINANYLVDGEPVGARNTDIRMVVSSKDSAPMLEPVAESEDVDFDSLELYDLTSIIPEVSADEMEQLMRGATMRDIYVQRQLDVAPVTKTVSAEEAEEIAKSLIK